MERVRTISWPTGVEESILRQKQVSNTIPVHAEYRRATHRREGATLIDSIHKETGCIVVAHWDHSTIKRFDVYAGTGLKSAVAAINKWITRGDQKSKESSAWAKVPAFNQAQWCQDQFELEQEEKMGLFLGPVPDMQEGEAMRPKITLDWPKDLLSIEVTPPTVFGNTLQALDDIRKRDGVFITLLPNNKVEILGFDINNVEAAEFHYKTLIERIRAEKCSLQQVTIMVLDEREGIDVVLLPAENWWPNHADRVVPRLLPSAIMDQPGSFREDGLHDTQLATIQTSVKRALEAVSYKKGSYEFLVRLGCIALDSKKMREDQIGQIHGKEKLIKSINGTIDLVPKKWLLDNVLGTKLYHRLIAADEFLQPVKSAGYWGTMSTSLSKTYPLLRGTWIFHDPSSSQRQPQPLARNVGRPTPMLHTLPTTAISTMDSLIIVQVDWTDDGEGSYDKTETRFYRLEAGKGGAKVNMDINLLELGQSRAWSFALESMMRILRSTVPPVLTGFAQGVVLRPGYDMTSNQSFAKWDKSPSVDALLQHWRLDKVYSFGIQDTCYKAELTAMWYPKQSLPCWGLAVRHTEWATHLAELEGLQTGHRASWGDTIATFLPDDGGSSTVLDEDGDFGVGKLKLDGKGEELQRGPSWEGVRVLTNILLRLSEVVSSVTVGEGDI
ncbi:hypothetical protein EKO04_006091 [Ascochyta lentis]|uniref:DUF7905 domain-containing protein n=1 Tax=Ascochyta lentis TaxID=205686 RepID=A0A8H7J1B3_9PLEO|nr:hypothetical protein EKO04_006091 [Ascochyta lentis]